MNFEEFKRRYIEKLERGGFVVPSDPDEYAAFEDKMADIYLGLMIYSEYQNEQAKKQMEAMKKQQRQKIILPGGMH